MATEIVNAPVTNVTTPAQAPVTPPMWRVMLLNDNSTDPRFVVQVLCDVFAIEPNAAMAIMMAAHHGTQALVNVMPRDLAETRVQQAASMIQAARGKNCMNRDAPCELRFSAEPETV